MQSDTPPGGIPGVPEDAGGANEAAFRAALAEAAPAVRRFLVTLSGDPQAAEDASQDVLLKAWRAREAFDGRSRLTTWLFRIARNHWLDLVRRRACMPGSEPLDRHEPAVADTGPCPAERRETAEAVRRALARLPAEQCEALALRESGTLTFEQAGEVLGVPAATVKSRVRYALLKLAEHLASLAPNAASPQETR